MKGKSHHVSETKGESQHASTLTEILHNFPPVQSQGDLHGLLSDSTQSSSMIASQLKSATQPKSSQNLSSSLKTVESTTNEKDKRTELERKKSNKISFQEVDKGVSKQRSRAGEDLSSAVDGTYLQTMVSAESVTGLQKYCSIWNYLLDLIIQVNI